MYGDELKLVWPQPGSDVEHLVQLAFAHRLIQPLDDAAVADNINACIDLVMADPRWRLSLQTHKALGRSEEHTSELQSLMRTSYAVFCLTKQTTQNKNIT